jgi:alpha-tubulin suppressor-like RCC1 family protein
MNIANLILQVKDQLSANPADQQALSKALKLLEVGAVQRAGSFATLPSAALTAGRLYFVDFDGLYWSTGALWFPIATTTYSEALSWGYNNKGQLGNSFCGGISASPVSVFCSFTDWCQVSASLESDHSLGVRTNGTLWAWGYNAQGRLGNNNTLDQCRPALVVGGFTDWCQAAAGSPHSLAVRTNGTLWAWGWGYSGALGNNTSTSSRSPVSVVGDFTDWCQVSAGYRSGVALRTNGTLWAWGRNASGSIGDGTTVSKSSPVSVIGGFTDWCRVSSGRDITLATRTNGTLWAWGRGSEGQLGDGATTGKSSPVSVVGGFTDWCQASAAHYHSLGLRTNGTLWAWGRGTEGRLGTGTTTNTSSPVSVIGGFTDWCQVSAGCRHSVAVRQNGSAWSWGYNGQGRLGDGTFIDKSSPVSVVGGFNDWCQASAGRAHNLAIRKIQL